MVWIYDDPPFTKREVRAYNAIRHKLKNKEFVEKLIRVVSLYVFLRRKHYSTTKEIMESAYYDKAKRVPIFNEQTAKQILKALNQQGGGDSKYPFMDVVIKEFLTSYTPNIIGQPVQFAYGTFTGLVDDLKSIIPFSDLVFEAVHSTTELGVTSANGLGEIVGGPVGALVVAPFTAVAAGFAAVLSAGEGDLGGAVAHIANRVPGLGLIFNKLMVQGERFAHVLKKHPTVAAYIPYMEKFQQETEAQEEPPLQIQDQDQPSEGGKRFSTNRPSSRKWRKTMRQPKSGL
jgi:hypothetical protein